MIAVKCMLIQNFLLAAGVGCYKVQIENALGTETIEVNDNPPTDIDDNQPCSKGLFGRTCKYLCRCVNQRCRPSGDCLDKASCVRGWFGPQCQFFNILQENKSLPAWLLDENSATCNDNGTSSITFHMHLHVTWIRLYINDTHLLTDFQVLTLDDTQLCPNVVIFPVDDNTVDIYCPAIFDVQGIKLNGAAVPFLCSVFVSIGRNIAVRQNVMLGNGIVLGGYLDSVVNGIIEDDLESLKCIHVQTIQKPNSEFLYILLTFDQRTTTQITGGARAIGWGTTGGSTRDRRPNTGFSINVFGKEGSIITTNQDILDDKLLVLPVPPSQASIAILMSTSRFRAAKLCELEMYGETVCPSGLYGLDCQQQCQCNMAKCHVGTGGCLAGCPPGFRYMNCSSACPSGTYGQACESKCSKNCIDGMCDPRTGHCISGCQLGYLPPHCENECLKGTYGNNCELECSINCLHTQECDTKTGQCRIGCQPGFAGTKCDQQCTGHVQGYSCIKNCPIKCTECDEEEACSRCFDGFLLPDCNETCTDGSYGVQCISKCAVNCLNKRCDHITGRCLACDARHTGMFCDEEISGLNGMYIAVPVGVVSIFLIFCLLRKAKSRLSEDMESEGKDLTSALSDNDDLSL